MSSEKNLRVRVKVFDNSTTIYSQDVEIIQGEGTFVVPAMLSDNEIIVLQVSTPVRFVSLSVRNLYRVVRNIACSELMSVHQIRFRFDVVVQIANSFARKTCTRD